ncbi:MULTISPECIES: hypothetical protein [Catenuloplanes]|uniref:Septal ring-binding cell division protein DamX n=1 Tax=Catenuloplanes niger TaxID=587534 RepID=A0AAE3ZZW8_9ACTN|nr:hypothetical protein [Catenuloplanes niger]MDR7328070.1 septal ring-binding cell division protein DamX [Catenuloplanes niger]
MTQIMGGNPTAAATESHTPLRLLASSCTQGQCPTVYASSPGKVVVQGYIVSAASAGIDVPEGEMLVEIPSHLLIEAFEKMS